MSSVLGWIQAVCEFHGLGQAFKMQDLETSAVLVARL
jgi:hypothetical protein